MYSFKVKCAKNYNVHILNFRQSSCGDAADYGQFGKLQVIYDVIGCYLSVAGTLLSTMRCSSRVMRQNLADQEIKCVHLSFTYSLGTDLTYSLLTTSKGPYNFLKKIIIQ